MRIDDLELNCVVVKQLKDAFKKRINISYFVKYRY